MKISEKTQNILKDYVQHVLNVRRQQEELYYKMELVDIAYARYMRNIDPKTGVVHGEGIDAATTPAGVFNTSPTVPPIVVSQVERYSCPAPPFSLSCLTLLIEKLLGPWRVLLTIMLLWVVMLGSSYYFFVRQ